MTSLRLLFENDRVRISDLRLPPGESIKIALTFPTVRWQVGDAIHQGAAANNKIDERVLVKDKHVTFEESGTHCEIVNLGRALDDDSVSRQIWFEIKQQQPRRSEEETQELLAKAIHTTNVGTELLFENRWCRVWDFYLEAGEGDPKLPHHHVLDYVYVYVAPGRLLGYTHDGTPGLFDSINDDGDVTFNDIPEGAEADVTYAHGAKNGHNDRPMREYLVELK
jgi:hypothetical protein